MVAKLTSLTHKIAIEMHLVAESCIICSSCSRRLVRKLLDTPSYVLLKLCSPNKQIRDGETENSGRKGFTYKILCCQSVLVWMTANV